MVCARAQTITSESFVLMPCNERRRPCRTFLAGALGVLAVRASACTTGCSRTAAAAAAAAEPEAEAKKKNNHVQTRVAEQHGQSLAPPSGGLKELTVWRR